MGPNGFMAEAVLRAGAASLAVGVTTATIAAWLACRLLQSGSSRKTIWQAATAAICVLLLTETVGLRWRADNQAGPLPLPAVGLDMPVGTASATAGDQSESSMPAPEETLTWPRPLAWLWLGGTGLLLARLLSAHVLLARLAYRMRPVDGVLLRQIDCVARRMQVRPPSSGSVVGLQGPFVFGIAFPKLALPSRFIDEWPLVRREAILAHEIAHIRGQDATWGLLSDVVTACVWWHPLAWGVRAALKRESEFAADEATRIIQGAPITLAECLLVQGRRLAGKGLEIAAGGAQSTLGRRIESLLLLGVDRRRSDGNRRLRNVPAVVVLVACVTGAAGAGPWISGRSAEMGSATWRSLAVSLAVAAGGHQAFAQAGPAGEGVSPRRAAPAKQEKTEAKAASAAGLNAEQQEKFDAMLKEREAKYVAFRALKSGHVEEGTKINKWWNEGLKGFMTSEQYRAYVAYWSGRSGGAVAKAGSVPVSPARIRMAGKAGAAKVAGAVVGGPVDFDAAETRILDSLNLTDEQKDKVAAHRGKMSAANKEFASLRASGDHAAAAKKGSEINTLARDGMKRILTGEQYEKYTAAWNALLSSGGSRGPAIAAPKGR
jgi:beta-lactamase regulating signal transducer with metallopeptidase domain